MCRFLRGMLRGMHLAVVTIQVAPELRSASKGCLVKEAAPPGPLWTASLEMRSSCEQVCVSSYIDYLSGRWMSPLGPVAPNRRVLYAIYKHPANRVVLRRFQMSWATRVCLPAPRLSVPYLIQRSQRRLSMVIGVGTCQVPRPIRLC